MCVVVFKAYCISYLPQLHWTIIYHDFFNLVNCFFFGISLLYARRWCSLGRIQIQQTSWYLLRIKKKTHLSLHGTPFYSLLIHELFNLIHNNGLGLFMFNLFINSIIVLKTIWSFILAYSCFQIFIFFVPSVLSSDIVE